MSRRWREIAKLWIGLSLLVASSTVSAQDGGWRWSFAPYGWGMNIEGDSRLGPLSSDIDVGFDDLLEGLNFAAMAHVEASRGRWSLIMDGVYGKVSADSGFGPVAVGPFTIGGTTVGPFAVARRSFEVQTEMLIVEAAAAYRIGGASDGGLEKGSAFELLAGARYTDLELEVDFAAFPTVKRGVDYLDPFVGFRLHAPLAKSWSFRGRGDVGGFGVGSEFSWQAAALFVRQWGEKREFVVGYRALNQRYETSGGRFSYEHDLTIHGPIVGVNFKF